MVKSYYDKDDINKIIQRRFFRNFIDLLILYEIYKTPFIGGYDIIVAFQKRFRSSISPGTIYSILYKLEREGLIRGKNRGRKRIYTLTTKGEKLLKESFKVQENIKLILSKILINNSTQIHDEV
ncbi:MAG: PadR family transcriptional regulator [Candidatus Bathyarchaeia archaeon]